MQQSSLEHQQKQETKLEARSKFRFAWVTEHFGVLVLITSLTLYLVTLNGMWATDHTTAIVEFQYSLWANHSFILGRVGSFTSNTVDVFKYKGNYYMANAPGVAFLTLPGAIAAFVLNGGHFSVFGNVLVFTEIPVAIANSLAAYFVYRVGNYYFRTDVSTFLAFCYAFSTISWPFATYLFQSDVSALFDLIAAFLVIKIGRTNSPTGEFALTALAGLAVAFGTFTDYVNGVLIPIIGVYLLFTLGKNCWRAVAKAVAGFLVGSLFPVSVLLGLYNYLSFGRVFVSSEELYLGSSYLFGSFTFPVDLGMILNLFTPMRGLFFFSPVLLLGAWGFWKMMRDSRVDSESFLFLAIFLSIFGLYSAWYEPTGGLSFGPRLIISSIPFLLVPAGFVISEARGRFSYTFVYLLYAAGVCINGVAGFTGALSSPGNWLTSPFFSTSLPKLLTGGLDVWWRSYAGAYWPIIMACLMGFVLFVPMACSWLFEIRRMDSSAPVYYGEPRNDSDSSSYL